MKLSYRPEIDGLRSIAVGVVILYHAQINIMDLEPFRGGFIGVDIFFVISGYLITSIILKELIITGSFSFKHFYERRIRRILPALLFVMLVSFPLAWIYLMPSSFIDFSKSILYSLGFSSNFYFNYSGQEYGAESSLLKPFLHTWSLSVEEQYYILFPIVLLIVFKYFRKFLIHILILGFIISLGLAEWTSRNYPSVSFYFLHTRMWELLAGSILAYFEITKGHRGQHKTLNLILPTVGLLLISHYVLFFNDETLHPSIYTLFPIIGACLIIWFSHKDELITKILSTKLFVGIGLISYSLYLWHYPIFAFYKYSFAKGSLYIEILIILSLFIISCMSYFFVEKNFRNSQFKFSRISNILFLSTFLICLICIFIINQKGFPKKSIVDNMNLDFQYYVEEISNWQKINVNKKITNDQKEIITIIGDSHASNFALMFQTNPDLYSNFRFVPVRINKFKKIMNDESKINKEMLLIKKSNIIIFSFNYTESELEEVEKTIKSILKKTNKKIILTTNNPVFNLYGSRFTDLDFFLLNKKRKPNKNELINLEKKYFSFLEKNKVYHQNNIRLQDLSKTYNLKLLDKSFYQCDDINKRCEVLTNNYNKINYDSHHYTLDGAKYLGKKIYKHNWLQLN
ncbi:acyltransferase family protein [Candidatus Pelagibacter bacterium nBUS_28]|jgi:peptidoglycan/LPS O-acetylase OafA/YrhL|uniref:acyltransferase family protein n=1 Tax=Candidatus Pelagibacter bacterium nBUS_28 TaxID=3374189 RepID=UPI003EBF32C2